MTQPMEHARGCFLDVSVRTKLRVIGADRFRFLNGQISNDPRKATETGALEACLLNAKGKMDAHIFVHACGDAFLLDADPGVREALHARLDRYIIADDVEIEDVTEQFLMFHVVSSQKPTTGNDAMIVSARRFTESGWDVWSATANHDALRQQLSSTFAFVDSDSAEVMRIEQGIPRWGRELTHEIIPIEANLEERTIDYEKGCYIGQEVISRMKMSGQTNKRLCGMISLNNIPLQPQLKLAAPSAADQKEAGWITSATRSERLGKEIALGYVKRGFNTSGAKLNAFAPGQIETIPVEVVPLPFT
jgi:folate-binding protein YgfZ